MASEDSVPYLTAQGRAKLTEKAAWLRDQRLPELREVLMDPQRDPTVEADFERALDELGRLDGILSVAKDVETLPDDPQVVELGDIVLVEYDDGTLDKFVMVDPVEAPVDDERISVTSPLAKAIMGRRLGEKVEVHGPRGSYEVWILHASREPLPAGDEPARG